jgi:acetate kinase
MFNKKLKQELVKYKGELERVDSIYIKKSKELAIYKESNELQLKKIDFLKIEVEQKSKEIEKLQQFDKKMIEKIEELCKPKINDFCLSMAGSGIVVGSNQFNSEINVLNKSYKSLEELLESQAKELAYLKARDEDNKQLLFLATKVEQLINKLNKK